MPILQVQGLSKSYRQASGESTMAIGDITCEVEAGEFVSFVGPSGCGKTTLLMSIAGLIAPSAGRVIVNGVPTGVEVGPATNHGGPWPASTDVRFTSVGTAALQRFIRPVAYQNCPQALLPPALHDANPLGIERLVNGAASDTPL